MKKKLLAALLATAMTVTMFAGCGTPGSKDSKKEESESSGQQCFIRKEENYLHTS